MIRDVKPGDEEFIADIYNFYIEHTVITFEEETISTSAMRDRIAEYSKHLPYIVFERENKVIGYAYASRYHTRSAYKQTVESTVYVKNGETKRGLGSLLYTALIDRLKQRNIHAIIGAVSLPNEMSQALHEKMGFKKVGHFPEVGKKFGNWVDVGYWQLILQ